MPRRGRPEDTRLGRLEILGVWLRVWTPPRGAVVPPVPRRRLLTGAGLAALALSAAALYAIPRIDRSKERATAQEQRARVELEAAERRRLAADQRPVRGRLRPVRAGKAEAVAAAEEAVIAEARRRSRAGRLEGTVVRAECRPAPGNEARGRRAYDCVAVTRDIPATASNPAGVIGHPFRAVVDVRRLTYTVCKANPPPGEAAIPDPRRLEALPVACRTP